MSAAVAAAAEAEWRRALIALDTALQDATIAAGQLAGIRAGWAVLEASAVLAAEGKDETQRAASVTLALAHNPQATRYRGDEAATLARLADALRRERLATEHCRLALALLALHTSSGRGQEVAP